MELVFCCIFFRYLYCVTFRGGGSGVTVAHFDFEAFVTEPTVDRLSDCCKRDLLEIAVHYTIFVLLSLRKDALRVPLVDALILKGVFIVEDTLAMLEQKPVTLPHFVSFSAESNPVSKVDV